MPLTTIVVMVDDLDPEYLECCSTPIIGQLAKDGFLVEGKAMVPTVTNVNNVSLVTASYPETHGITSNYWFNRQTASEVYMESGEFVECESMFQRAEAVEVTRLLCSGGS